jgi:hypothetical protein
LVAVGSGGSHNVIFLFTNTPLDSVASLNRMNLDNHVSALEVFMQILF